MSTGNSDVMKGRYTKFIYEMIELVKENEAKQLHMRFSFELRSKILREFFTVGYAGTRQTGKSYSAIEFLLKNDGYILLSPYYSIMEGYAEIAREIGGEEAVTELRKRTYLYGNAISVEFDPSVLNVKGVIVDEAETAFSRIGRNKYYNWLYRSLNKHTTKPDEEKFVPTILVY